MGAEPSLTGCEWWVWVGVRTARAKVYVDDGGHGFTLQPEGGWPRAITATSVQSSRRRRQQTPDAAAEDTRPHTQPLPRPVSQVRDVDPSRIRAGVWWRLGFVETDMLGVGCTSAAYDH